MSHHHHNKLAYVLIAFPENRALEGGLVERGEGGLVILKSQEPPPPLRSAERHVGLAAGLIKGHCASWAPDPEQRIKGA